MKSLSPVLLALLVMSCGKEAGEKKSTVSPRNVVATNRSKNPLPLESDRNKSLCSVLSYKDAHRNLNLSLFLRGEGVDEDRMFTGLIDGLSVKDVGGKIVSKSTKGYSVIEKFTSTDDVITREETILSQESNLSVCPDDGKYARGSAESAALNVTYFISKTSRKIRELLPAVEIAPIEVRISPMIKKAFSVIIKGEVVWSFEAYDTDNAYYEPGKNSITFLPHSREFRDAGMTMSFWEVPMVASHEYGHHIFETILPTLTTGSLNCFGKFHLHTETEGQARAVSNMDILYSFHEGFADLVSYYTLDNLERGLKGVSCLEISREVGSDVFANGEKKIFTKAALDAFFSAKELQPSDDCKVPNFQDGHIMGAVFANGADRLMSLSTDTKDQRMAIVLAWLQEMKVKQESMKALTPRDFLEASLSLFVQKTAAMTDGKIDDNECQLAAEIYPGLDAVIPGCIPR